MPRLIRSSRGAAEQGRSSVSKDAKPRTLSVIGARGGVGATTVAITIASMLGTRLKEEILLIDFDLHYGSLMLALDLEAIDALREALDQPDRIDALFIICGTQGDDCQTLRFSTRKQRGSVRARQYSNFAGYRTNVGRAASVSARTFFAVAFVGNVR